MVSGVGVDVISISRMKDVLQTGGKTFVNKTFTPQEQAQAETRSDPVAYFATLFAGKEAIFKCLAIGWESGVQFTEISVTHGKYGEPVPVLTGRFAELVSERGATKILLSLSYDADCALAMAILV